MRVSVIILYGTNTAPERCSCGWRAYAGPKRSPLKELLNHTCVISITHCSAARICTKHILRTTCFVYLTRPDSSCSTTKYCGPLSLMAVRVSKVFATILHSSKALAASLQDCRRSIPTVLGTLPIDGRT